MAFQTGLSGLNAASQSLDVIGNNVANAGTVGFKQSRVLFSDVFANSLNGSGASAIGIGTQVAAIEQDFTQGAVTTTSNPLDIAINGKGFFRLSDNGTISYTRNGQFHLDNAGYIVNSENLQITGYGVDASGNIVPTAPAPMQLSNAQLPPTPTTGFRVSLNLDSSETLPATAVFNAADPTSYNDSTSGSVIDSLGNSHVFTLYFVKTAIAGQWDLHATVDGTAVANVDLGAGAGNPINLNFSSSGALTTAMPIAAVALTVGGGAVSPLTFSTDFSGSSQFGASFAVNSLIQDGFASGRLAGFNVSADGIMVGHYTNGQSRNLGQFVLANFSDPRGLKPLGGGRWDETADSGLPVVGAPGSGDLGAVQASATESSNVDLTAELVNMITAQRVYQANAQSIKTQDAVLQTLVNLK
ncbi:MAG: flagellar hook protein FlgE [Betaproteobacteria bacterium]|nr:flagellar hook protein FlgE [Betaproteobacteria bacterium]